MPYYIREYFEANGVNILVHDLRALSRAVQIFLQNFDGRTYKDFRRYVVSHAYNNAGEEVTVRSGFLGWEKWDGGIHLQMQLTGREKARVVVTFQAFDLDEGLAKEYGWSKVG